MKAAIALLAFLLGAAASAQTVYRSVENGVTTFSDTPPADGEAEMISVEVPEPADDGLLESRLAQMRETTDRMAADRREREKQRAELRALRTPVPVVPAAPAATVAAGAPWSAWANPWVRPWPGARPPLRPRPPGHAPPRAPAGWSVLKPGNAQLMRPIVSSRE